MILRVHEARPTVRIHNHFARDRQEDGTISVTFKGDEDNQIIKLLDHIKRTAAVGHSFSVVVDPGDSEHEQKFGFDGDGAFRIVEIK